ncbi:MAG: hypothetical protein US79_C0003G0074 [Parcubacteria group bacterium GW2011_GWC1_38_17]|nr:MAG: hypothetical protein US06_C0012G0005 [Parcubacteria group bacterium GW2011_GWC2_36_17]KKQ58773.1 MAG: hypothetical protein US79_C0003G0074 [Parcubacteria group bacterium GW2011_GWC1_38_17]
MSNHAQFEEEKQQQKLEELHKEEEEKFAQHIAEKNNLPYANLFVAIINPEALFLITEKTAEEAESAIIQKTDETLFIAIRDPQNPKTKELLNHLQIKYRLKIMVVSLRSLKKAWEFYRAAEKKEMKGSLDISPNTISQFEKEIKTTADVQEKFKTTHEDIVHILELTIGASLGLSASDIHFEPQEKETILRYRIDGILHEIVALDKKIYKSILTRIKLISGLKINITEIPQDGRFTIKLGELEVEVRVSILPGAYGEDLVMRILHPKTISVPLEELGFQKFHYDIIAREIQRPNGIILVTGPTGSGKTTTLYAFLKKLNSPEVKIITIEDPVEYHVEGLAQTQVNPERGLTFASALRSILRQDPDIILLGEMRDLETVEVAIHAALTGHLVFSTLHTNDAVASIPRLIDMNANPSILSSALNMVLAQRLVRKVCKNCGIKQKISETELILLKESLSGLPKEYNVPEIDKNTEIPKSVGCQTCNNTGYKGRLGIFEIFFLDEEIKSVILKSPSLFDLKKLADKKGMITMKQEGLLKVLRGLTTIEEVISTTG